MREIEFRLPDFQLMLDGFDAGLEILLGSTRFPARCRRALSRPERAASAGGRPTSNPMAPITKGISRSMKPESRHLSTRKVRGAAGIARRAFLGADDAIGHGMQASLRVGGGDGPSPSAWVAIMAGNPAFHQPVAQAQDFVPPGRFAGQNGEQGFKGVEDNSLGANFIGHAL